MTKVFFICLILKWQTSDLLTAFGLIISVLTLILGYIAYKKLLVQEASKAQLKIVLNLVELLGNSVIPLIYFNQNNIFNWFLTFNVLKLCNYDAPYERMCAEVYLPKGYSIHPQTAKISNNALLPAKISFALLKFHNAFKQDQPRNFKELGGNYYVMGYTNQHDVSLHPVESFQYYEGGIVQLRIDTLNIRTEILKWLTSKGVHDYNFTVIDQSADLNGFQ